MFSFYNTKGSIIRDTLGLLSALKFPVSMFLRKSSVNFDSLLVLGFKFIGEVDQGKRLLRLFHFVKSEKHNFPSLPSGQEIR